MSLTTLFLVNQQDRKKIGKIEKQTQETRPVGLFELFCELAMEGTATSYSESRIYYLAYLLSKEGIQVKIKK